MTTTTLNPYLISYQNPKHHHLFAIRDRFPIFNRPSSAASFLMPPNLTVKLKCTNSSEQGDVGSGGGLKEVLSGMVDERVEKLLNREENRDLFDGLEKASLRVEIAKRELAEIEKQEIEAKQLKDYINQLESTTSEIAECEREILEAREMVDEAQRSLNIDGIGGSGNAIVEVENEEQIDRNEERLESVKAASISALVGSLAGLPFSITQVTSNSQLILPLTITFISCALFGVTFRYAVRRDLDNFQLKTGTSAAFAFVKGLGTLDGGPPLELEAGSFLSHAFSGALYVAGNLLVFLFAAVALDFSYKMRILSPFPIKKSASETK